MLSNKQKDLENIKRIIKKGKIDSKREFYLLYENNLLGNKVLTWDSYEEILKSEWKGNVCIRYKESSDRKRVIYDTSIEKLTELIYDLEKHGVQKEKILFNQSMPDKQLTIQGELMRNEYGFEMLYTQIKKPMNIALKEWEKSISGLKAKLVLESYVDPSSYSDINEILDLFPDSIIEFSCYNINVGTLPYRNTIIWEVRNY